MPRTFRSDHNSLQTVASYSRFISSQGWRSCLPALVLLPQLRALYAVDPSYATDIQIGSQFTADCRKLLALHIKSRLALLSARTGTAPAAQGAVRRRPELCHGHSDRITIHCRLSQATRASYQVKVGAPVCPHWYCSRSSGRCTP